MTRVVFGILVGFESRTAPCCLAGYCRQSGGNARIPLHPPMDGWEVFYYTAYNVLLEEQPPRRGQPSWRIRQVLNKCRDYGPYTLEELTNRSLLASLPPEALLVEFARATLDFALHEGLTEYDEFHPWPLVPYDPTEGAPVDDVPTNPQGLPSLPS